jgi:putative aldouronate transport system permease protein
MVSQNIFYLPHFISWVVVAGLCFDVFSFKGIINSAAAAMGLGQISFLTSSSWFRPVLVITSVWKGAGYGSIIYLAALTGIDPQLYEAARIDGAGRFKQLLYITLPELSATIVVMLVIGLSGVLNAGFDQIQLLLNPMVMEVGDVIDTYVYRMGMGKARYDFSTAVGLFKSAVNMFFVLAGNALARRIRGEGIW